ncbi:MAG: cytochrome C [Geobacter sp.]|nr:MAG: cytochrome C [Geobacter sp.]
MALSRIIAITAIVCMAAGTAGAADLSDQEQLGKSIFFDEALSSNQNQSCASCHNPTAGWTGSTSEVNAGTVVYEGSIPGSFGNRKPPSSAYATTSSIFHYDAKAGLFVGGNFWDGRARGERLGNPAAEQAQGPFLNPLEQALGAATDVIDRICGSSYADLFRTVCGSAACDQANVNEAYDCVGLSVAAFEGSFESNAFSSKFDAHLKGKARLAPSELQGFALFMGKGKCNKCHVISFGKKNGPALFTDYTFDNLGIPRYPDNPFYTAAPGFNPDGYNWIDPGLGGFLMTRAEFAAFADANYGKHKVPTLRNVDKRPSPDFVKAYGHNGYFKSLKRIVHFYNTRDVLPRCDSSVTDAEAEVMGCWPPPEVAATVNTAELGNLGLDDAEENALVDFMKTLTDGYQQ